VNGNVATKADRDIGGKRSYRPSGQRYSVVTSRPSTSPVSFRLWWNAARKWANPARLPLLRNPITGIVGCCARCERPRDRSAPNPRRT